MFFLGHAASLCWLWGTAAQLTNTCLPAPTDHHAGEQLRLNTHVRCHSGQTDSCLFTSLKQTTGPAGQPSGTHARGWSCSGPAQTGRFGWPSAVAGRYACCQQACLTSNQEYKNTSDGAPDCSLTFPPSLTRLLTLHSFDVSLSSDFHAAQSFSYTLSLFTQASQTSESTVSSSTSTSVLFRQSSAQTHRSLRLHSRRNSRHLLFFYRTCPRNHPTPFLICSTLQYASQSQETACLYFLVQIALISHHSLSIVGRPRDFHEKPKRVNACSVLNTSNISKNISHPSTKRSHCTLATVLSLQHHTLFLLACRSLCFPFILHFRRRR